MQYRELGTSGVEVSEVGFGAWVVGTDWWGDRDEEDAARMIEHALDQGINFFDTGDVYGHGRSEELVGDALADHREDVVLSTKIGYDFYNNPQAGHGELPKEMHVDYLREAFEKSLDRLDTDYVDLLMLHNANVEEVDADVREFLDELQEDGRVDAIGWALGPSIGWLAEGDAAIEYDFDVVQLVANVFEQDILKHFRKTVQDLDADTSLVPRVPHSSGLLNEQVTPDTELDEGDHRGFRPDEWYETGWEKLETIRFLERDGERTMAQAAIQWLLAHDEVASVTPTFRSEEDVTEWAAAPATPPLDKEEINRVADLYNGNFGVDRFDGMTAEDYRTSVDGDDLRDAGLVGTAD